MVALPTVRCTGCGSEIVLDQQTHWKYEGDIRCPECNALLSVRVVHGQLKETPRIKEPAIRERKLARTREASPDKGEDEYVKSQTSVE
jgi:DNA-directed RNA polymerase subunit RPC12/RpoP